MKRLIVFLVLVMPLAAQPEILRIIPKTSYEELNCSVAFVDNANVPIAVTLVSVTSVNASTSADSTSTIVASSPTPAVTNTNTVVFRVQKGSGKESHNVSVKVTNNSTGEKYQGIIQIQIK